MPGEYRQRRAGRGFTLVEVILSLAITSILLGAMGSLVVVASRSIPNPNGTTDLASAAAGMLEQLSADVAAAETIVLAIDRGIEVAVADRDGDGKREKIRYEWSGTPGESLERIYNDAYAGVQIPLTNFNLSYRVVATSTTSASIVSNVAESYVGGWSGGITFSEEKAESAKLVAQHFVPTLPAGTRSWKITRIRFLGRADFIATGSTDVQLRTVGADGLPTGTILASASVGEALLTPFLFMKQVNIVDMPSLAPNQEVAIVFACASNCPSINLGFATLATARATAMSTYNGAWSTSKLTVIPHEVYATTKTTAPHVTTVRRLEQVTAVLQTPGLSTPLTITITVHNAPEVQ